MSGHGWLNIAVFGTSNVFINIFQCSILEYLKKNVFYLQDMADIQSSERPVFRRYIRPEI